MLSLGLFWKKKPSESFANFWKFCFYWSPFVNKLVWSTILDKTLTYFFRFYQFRFTTSETELYYYYEKWMYGFLHELLNDLRLNVLGNWDIARKPWNAYIWRQESSWPPKKQIFDICSGKLRKPTLKHSIENYLLLNLMNLSTIFCLRL